MKRLTYTTLFVLLAITLRPAVADDRALDLRQAVPADAYLAVHGKHNSERDYQIPYFERIAATVKETRLLERTLEIVTERLAATHREQAVEWLERLKTAAEPIDLHALLTSKEVIYAQRMEPFDVHRQDGEPRTFFTSQHLVILRMTPDQAADYERGICNLFEVMEESSEGAVTIDTKPIDDHASLVSSMSLPRGAPYSPAVARIDDVILLSSSSDFLRQSVEMLLRGSGESKFDDPRVVDALRQLPEPEDAVVVYDGRTQFEQMRTMVDKIHQQTGSNPKVDRWVELTHLIFDEVAILDLLVTVEYTEGNRQHSDMLGRLMPDTADSVLVEMLSSGEPFVDWHRWVPADATAYSLSTGADFHPLYRRIENVIRERIPEMQLPLENFETWQRQIDLHFDVDILQAFSGESVTVTLPAAESSGMGTSGTVWAMRCHKPSRTQWLLERLIGQLNEYPLFQSQQLRLVECEELEGFHQISAAMCAIFGVRPVVGFHAGWMLVGSSSGVVQRVIDTRAGDAPTIADSEEFQQMQMEIEGPVQSVWYANIAERIQQVSKACQQAGGALPLVIGLAKANLETKGDVDKLAQLLPLQIVTELLSDVGKIIGEFDFLEANLTVIQDGPDPGTWRERSVTLIRPAG